MFRPRRRMRVSGCLAVLGGVGLVAAPARAQEAPAAPRDAGPYASVALGTGGFVLGGGVRLPVGEGWRLVGEVEAGGASDPRETRFRGPEGTAIPSKYEFLWLVPARAGAERRLFAGQIEDNVRPFVRLSAGPTLGLARPYFEDCNANDRFDRRADCNADGTVAPGEGERLLSGSERLTRLRAVPGVGATATLGAHVGRRRGVQTVSAAYRVDYLPAGVQLLEPQVQGRTRWFATPVFALAFRL